MEFISSHAVLVNVLFNNISFLILLFPIPIIHTTQLCAIKPVFTLTNQISERNLYASLVISMIRWHQRSLPLYTAITILFLFLFFFLAVVIASATDFLKKCIGYPDYAFYRPLIYFVLFPVQHFHLNESPMTKSRQQMVGLCLIGKARQYSKSIVPFCATI